MVWLKQFFVTTAFKQNFFLASFRADVYSTVLSLVPGQAWQAQESYGWCFLMTRAAIILWSGVIEYELNGMVSSSLMLIYILVYSKYLVLFLCEHYICGGPYVHWVELGENKAPSWGSGRNKDGAHVDTVVQYFLWSLHLDFKRAHPLPPQAPVPAGIFSKQACSPAEHLREISCHTRVKNQSSGNNRREQSHL